MSANKPNYSRFDFNLSTAMNGPRYEDLPIVGTRLVMIDARDANGNQALGAQVWVQIGKALGDALPMSINTEIVCDGGFEFVRFGWVAQAGLTATFLASDDRQGTGVRMQAPPTKQLVSTGSGTSMAASRVTVAAVATLIDPGSTTTQTRQIKNLATLATVYIDDATVTVATGYPIAPGESINLSGSNAPIYGIVAAGTAPVALIVEQ